MLSQDRQEPVNQSVNEIHELMELWKQRITPDNLRLSERFLDGQLSILIHLRPIDSSEMWVIELVSKPLRHTQFANPFCMTEHILADCKYEPVFSDIVEIVEFPKRVVPLFVRFASVKDFHCLGADSLYFSSLGRFVTGLVITNRKRAPLEHLRIGIRRVDIYKLENQMIQSATQIADDIRGGAESVECNPDGIGTPDKHVRDIRIAIGGAHLSVEFLKPSFHVSEVLLGPFNFRPHKG